MASIGIFEFGGERHEVHLSVQIGSIRIRVRNGEKSWANTFQSHYIEQLTEKTGAFKNFNLFTSILANAISNPGKNSFGTVQNGTKQGFTDNSLMQFRNEWVLAGAFNAI